MKPEKPNVLIVTLCKSLNAGAFLQAYAFQEVLASKGLNPYFLDIYGLRQTIKRTRSYRKPQNLTPAKIKFNYSKYKTFSRMEECLRYTKDRKSVADAAFLGSDEIWSVANKSFFPSPEFFGLNVPANTIFSYAPSAGNTDYSKARSRRSLYAGLKNIDLLSVRDNSTKDLVESLYPEKEVYKVLDPTFLYDFEHLEKDPLQLDQPYIAIYSYGMPKSRINDIQAFARRHNLPVVSIGFYHQWCDMSVPCTPFEFIGILKNSKFLVTDTFHGTVFAIKYRKNFISYGRRKSKIMDLLQDLSLYESQIDEGELAGMDTIHTDYSQANRIIEQKTEESHDFLNRCILKMKEPASRD